MDKYLNKTEKEIDSMMDFEFDFSITFKDLIDYVRDGFKSIWRKKR